MSEIVPVASIGRYYSDRETNEEPRRGKRKPADSKVQGVVRSMQKDLASVLFASASAPEVVLGQVALMELDRQEKTKRRRRLWNKKRPADG